MGESSMEPLMRNLHRKLAWHHERAKTFWRQGKYQEYNNQIVWCDEIIGQINQQTDLWKFDRLTHFIFATIQENDRLKKLYAPSR